MKPLFTQTEFDIATSRQKLPLICYRCEQPFLRPKNRIQAAIKNKDRRCNFCSHRCCGGNEKIPPIKAVCRQCGNPFKKDHSQTRKTKNDFCSMTCAAKWHNAHKTKGTRVSKLERWLQEQLPLFFPSLEFHFNRTDAVEAELDVFIPSLRLAFELNGIFHYEPIYGTKKFASVLKNDHRKMLACAERGIELCVIDVSTVSYFKPIRAQKFLNIVTNLIRTKLSGDSPALLPLPSRNRVEVP